MAHSNLKEMLLKLRIISWQGKRKRVSVKSPLKNLEGLSNSSYFFNTNVPYATIMLKDIKTIIKELIVNIQMLLFGALAVCSIKLLEN